MQLTKIKIFTFFFVIILLLLIIKCLFPTQVEGFKPKDIIDNIEKVSTVVTDVKKNVMNIDDKFKGLTNTIRKEATGIAEDVGKEVEGKAKKFAEEVEDKAKKFAEEVENKTMKSIQQVENQSKIIAKEVEKKAMKGIQEVTQSINKVRNIALKAQDLFVKLSKEIYSLKDKIVKFGSGFVSIMKDAIVDPFMTLFLGLGKIFQQLFGILQEIGNKIVSLQGCAIFYISDSIYNTIVLISKTILPKFVTKIIGTIYDYTLGAIFQWFLNLFEYNETKKQCYGFDVNAQVSKITNEFNKISETFTEDFGRFDMKKLGL